MIYKQKGFSTIPMILVLALVAVIPLTTLLLQRQTSNYTKASNPNPGFTNTITGYLEDISCTSTTIKGFVCDSDNFSHSVLIRIWLIDKNGQKTFLDGSAIWAGDESPSSDLACAGTTNHGFSYVIPDNLKDSLNGGKIQIVAWSINNSGSMDGNTVELPDSPKSVVCSNSNPSPSSVPNPSSTSLNNFKMTVLGNGVTSLSSLLLDESTIIDFTSCPYSATTPWVGSCGVARLNELGIDKNKIDTILITHNHDDHFRAEEIVRLAQARTSNTKLTVYAGKSVIDLLTQYLASHNLQNLLNSYHLSAFQPTATSHFVITALNANHPADIEPYVYLVKKGDKQILYATDTGYLNDEDIDYLKDHKPDLVFYEGTFHECSNKNPMAGHMDNCMINTMRDNWISQGIITSSTPWYLTHVHNWMWPDCNHACQLDIQSGFPVKPAEGSIINLSVNYPTSIPTPPPISTPTTIETPPFNWKISIDFKCSDGSVPKDTSSFKINYAFWPDGPGRAVYDPAWQETVLNGTTGGSILGRRSDYTYGNAYLYATDLGNTYITFYKTPDTSRFTTGGLFGLPQNTITKWNYYTANTEPLNFTFQSPEQFCSSAKPTTPNPVSCTYSTPPSGCSYQTIQCVTIPCCKQLVCDNNLPGDLNHDKFVNLSDFQYWKTQYDQALMTLTEFLIWKNVYVNQP